MPTTHGYGDVDAPGLALQHVAEGHQSLRTGFIDGKTAQRGAASGKEQLAGGHKASGKWRRQPEPNTVGEYQGVKRLVKSILSEELGEIRTGAQRGRRDCEINSCEYAAVCVQGLVARVAEQCSGES